MIKENFDQIMDEFGTQVLNYKWADKKFYGEWLYQTYCFVSHSTRLLSLGAATAELSEEGLHKRFLEHLNEEKGHEIIAKKDIEGLGYNLDSFSEFPETTHFYRNQYFVTQKNGPTALMGWILFLEGIACKFGYDLMEKVRPHGPRTTAFLRVHAGEDIKHLDEAFSAIKEIPPHKEDWLIDNMWLSYKTYKAILDKANMLH